MKPLPGVLFLALTFLLAACQGSSEGTGERKEPIESPPSAEWVVRYNGPANGGDSARAIAVDGVGNTYVTGISLGAGTAHDFATIKYDPQGNLLWVARYNGPANRDDEAKAIAVDGNGFVYVTGYSDGGVTNLDYATLKYARDGTELWAARYDGPGHGKDVPTAIAADGEGSVYVIGNASPTDKDRDANAAMVKYSPDGVEEWSVSDEQPRRWALALRLDAAGAPYVAGGIWSRGGYENLFEHTDFVTTKFDANGATAWTTTWDGPEHMARLLQFKGDEHPVPSQDLATALAIDGSGNVYVGGGSNGGIRVAKYDTTGREQWVADLPTGCGGPTFGDRMGWIKADDEPRGLVVDPEGNIYVAGVSCREGDVGYLVGKLDAAGAVVWATIYRSSDTRPTGMALDSQGNQYLTGNAPSHPRFPIGDYTTVRVDSGGSLRWVARYDGPGKGVDEPAAITVDSQGNVYVTGSSLGDSTDQDYATIKYPAVASAP